jgi:hypothetical protein
MSVQDLGASITALMAEKDAALQRLEPLRSGAVRPVASEEKAQTDRDRRMWEYRAEMRKKICMDLWGCVTEAMPDGKTMEELWVGLGGPRGGFSSLIADVSPGGVGARGGSVNRWHRDGLPAGRCAGPVSAREVP